MNILCKLGIHNYKSERIWEEKLSCLTLFLNGRVCIRCRKVHSADQYQANVMMIESTKHRILTWV